MFDRLLHLVATQNEHRRTWSENDSPDSLARQIREEADELVHAINEYEVSPDGVFNIVGEVGDVLYLALKLCGDLGIDPSQAVELKLLRNSLKYSDYTHSNGYSHEDATAFSRSLWLAMGGDHTFFMAYLDVLGSTGDGSTSDIIPEPNADAPGGT